MDEDNSGTWTIVTNKKKEAAARPKPKPKPAIPPQYTDVPPKLNEYGSFTFIGFTPRNVNTIETELVRDGFRKSNKMDFKISDHEKKITKFDGCQCCDLDRGTALKLRRIIKRVVYPCGLCVCCNSGYMPFEYEVNEIYINDITGKICMLGDKCCIPYMIKEEERKKKEQEQEQEKEQKQTN